MIRGVLEIYVRVNFSKTKAKEDKVLVTVICSYVHATYFSPMMRKSLLDVRMGGEWGLGLQ